jgi:hypothetical protein
MLVRGRGDDGGGLGGDRGCGQPVGASAFDGTGAGEDGGLGDRCSGFGIVCLGVDAWGRSYELGWACCFG